MNSKSLSSPSPSDQSTAGQRKPEVCEVRVLRSASELDEVRDAWIAWQNHPNANMDLFRLVMDTREEIKQPNVVAVLRQGNVESLLLARTLEARVPFKFGYLTLWRPRIRSLDVLHEGFIGTVTDDGALAAVKALLQELDRGKADRLGLGLQREGTPLMTAVRQIPGWFSRDFAPVTALHRAMELPQAPGEFLRRMKSKHRSWLKAKTRDLDAKFNRSVRYAMFSRPEDIAKVMVDVEAVAAKTYLRGLGTGFRNDVEHIRRFEMEAKAGRLRICILYGADVPQAFWIGFVYGNTFHSGYTGYDAAMREFEVGTLVFVYLIDRLCEENVKIFDFGLGDAFYKQRFADQCWNEVSISIYRPSLRGAGLKLAFTVHYHFVRFLHSVLKRLKLVDWVKRTWRAKKTQPSKERGNGTQV
jgi:hypothetical protein